MRGEGSYVDIWLLTSTILIIPRKPRPTTAVYRKHTSNNTPPILPLPILQRAPQVVQSADFDGRAVPEVEECLAGKSDRADCQTREDL